MDESELRDLRELAVARVGRLVDVSDVVVPVRLLDPVDDEVQAVTVFLRDMRACDRSVGSQRSYGRALLRWFRFLWAVGVSWDRAGRVEARDFMLWLAVEPKPARPRRQDAAAPGTVNALTRKAYPGLFYAPRTRRHNHTVVRAFYEFHRDQGSGPMVNPMPSRRGRHGGRADAHHNPMQPHEVGRRADFRPKLPHRAPPFVPDQAFNDLFAAMPSNRDRAILAFYISTAARASELLGVTCDRVDVGQQLVGVYRKGSGALQWLPASADAFVWLALYQQGLRRRVGRGAADPLWWTLRRPHRQLTYAALRAVLLRANAKLGTNWSLHDLRHTAARRMLADPRMTLADVQWLLGHAQITSTQVYMEPVFEDLVERMRTYHAAQATPRPAPVPAAGYRSEVLDVLLGGPR
jgi:integrase